MSVFFVATKHDEYQDRTYPEGSVVIDPWGYIPDQPGVRVNRVGRRGTRETISVLCPTRGRPDSFRRMAASAHDLAAQSSTIEIVAYIDDDDPADYTEATTAAWPRQIRCVTGPRIVLSEAWNRCYDAAAGPIYMHAGDDIVFRTRGWDNLVRDTFTEHPDGIVFVHGDDGAPSYHGDFGTHGFVHRNWVETVGYFCPPYFTSDYNDTWLNDVANRIGRRVYVPKLFTEHMHPDWGKAEIDDTHRDRLQRHERDQPGALYERLQPERERDAQKLRERSGAWTG